jgi:hypothetical protein
MTSLDDYATPVPQRSARLSKVQLVLAVDAIASGLVGLGLAALSIPIARWIDLSSATPVFVIGLLLTGYAVLLGGCAQAGDPIPERTAKVTVYTDEAWIIASVGVAVVVSMPGLAVMFVFGQALVVAGFAVAKRRVTR